MTPQTYAIIGYSILSIPFIILGAIVVRDSGWKGFFTVFGITALIYLIVVTGAHFLQLAGIVK